MGDLAMSAARDKTLRMSYRIGRGETGVLTFEPYKSILLPHWRFRTVAIATQSSQKLWSKFVQYEEEDDFVGMDMCRKFIQMGMTRAKRYANHKGGKKYDKKSGMELEKSVERCKAHDGYKNKKEAFLKEQKEWERERKRAVMGEEVK
ncbi:MAG: hypothetical protein Q9208_005808 [Pyrenodesmia sp. 3 TL-2023]